LQHKLNPDVFGDAISLLRDRGWTNEPSSYLSLGKPLCIWQAVQRSAALHGININSIEFGRYEDELIYQTGFDALEELWIHNDGMNKDHGLAWSCDVLRVLQEKAADNLRWYDRLWRKLKSWV
jgi:hypothetical protein